MFENIPYFRFLSSDLYDASKEFTIGSEIKLDNWSSSSVEKSENSFFCISPPEFDLYARWVDEHWYYKSNGCYFIEDEYDDDYILDKPLVPIETFLNKFVFLKINVVDEKKSKRLFIEELFDAETIFTYWIKQNHFSDITQWRKLGLGRGIYDNLPDGHNYYDRNFLCTCGEAGCDNMEAWYIKYANSFSIPFIVDLGKRLVFDLEFFKDSYKWEEEEYEEAYYDHQGMHNNFPFNFEAAKFELFEKTLFKNLEPAP